MDTPSLRKRKKPSFFKVLIQEFSTSLPIPPAFIREFGKRVPKKTILQTYSDKSGESVEVEKHENRFYFTNGWGQFVKDNNLEEGDFLIFKYFADSSKFKVKIYGRTCCEKQSDGGRGRCSGSLNVKEDQSNVQGEEKRKRDEVEDDDSDVNNDGDSKCSKRIETESDGPEASERDVISIDSHSSSDADDQDDDEFGDLKQRNEKCRRLPTAEQIKFKSENPFFQVELKVSSLSAYMHIPASFSRKHIRKEHQNHGIKLEIFNKKIWNLGLLALCGPENRKLKDARVTRGWKRFTRENHLKKGDVCFFEMIQNNDEELMFRVHVYRLDEKTEKLIHIVECDQMHTSN